MTPARNWLCKVELVPGANVDGSPTRVVFEVVLHGTE